MGHIRSTFNHQSTPNAQAWHDLHSDAFDQGKRITVAFDVDGTLIGEHDQPRQHVINLLKKLAAQDNVRVLIWSGGSDAYARTWANRLKLDVPTAGKPSVKDSDWVDYAIDDQSECKLGKRQVIV